MKIAGPNHVMVSYDMEEIHDLSVDLLQYLEDADVPTGLAVASLALTVGRLMSSKMPLEMEEEINYLQHILEHIGLYFAEGKVN